MIQVMRLRLSYIRQTQKNHETRFLIIQKFLKIAIKTSRIKFGIKNK
jgi:hypothetical protein